MLFAPFVSATFAQPEDRFVFVASSAYSGWWSDGAIDGVVDEVWNRVYVASFRGDTIVVYTHDPETGTMSLLAIVVVHDSALGPTFVQRLEDAQPDPAIRASAVARETLRALARADHLRRAR